MSELETKLVEELELQPEVKTFVDVIYDVNILPNIKPVGKCLLVKGVQKDFKTFNILSIDQKNFTVTADYMEVIAANDEYKDWIGKRIVINGYVRADLASKAIPTDLNPQRFTTFIDRARKLSKEDYSLFIKVYPTIDIINYFILDAVDVIGIVE